MYRWHDWRAWCMKPDAQNAFANQVTRNSMKSTIAFTNGGEGWRTVYQKGWRAQPYIRWQNISHLFARLTTRCQAPQQIGLSSAKRQLVKPSSLLIKWRAQFSEAHKFTSLKEYRQPNSTSQNWRGCQILLAAIFKFISAPMASRQQKNARASSNFSQQQEEKPF